MEEKSQIDNTELFNFEFVDRQKEKKVLENFLDHNHNKILWVYGESGIGKTFFVKKITENVNDYEIIYIDNEKENNDGDCIIKLIDELQSIIKPKFYNFLQQNYKGIRALASDLLKITKIDIWKSNFLEYVLSKNSFFVDKNNEHNDLAIVLKRYIEKVPKGKKIVFIIDNLHRCDRNSFNIIINFAKCNLNNDRCRFIFISSDSEKDNNNFKNQLCREIPYKDIHIPPIPDKDLFINMLPSHHFDISNLTKNDIDKIYSFCKGFPERFQDLLCNLNINHSINYEESKIKINKKEMLNYMIEENNSNLKIDKYFLEEKCILLVIVCMGLPVRIDLLFKLSKMLYQKLFIFPIDDVNYMNAIRNLIPKPLKNIIKGNRTYIYTDHDLTFDAAKMYFNDNNLYNMACCYVYNYLNDNTISEFIDCFDENARNELFANLSYYAQNPQNPQNPDWIQKNYFCGLCFYDNHNYIQAFKYFARLISCREDLTDEQFMKIGVTAYEIGDYNQAVDILSKINENKINEKYKYYIYMGKSLNMTVKESPAISFFNKAILIAEQDSDNEIYAKYMKHLVLLQIPRYANEAKEIYEDLVKQILIAYDNNIEKKLYLPSNAKLLRCCYDYYFNEEALHLLNIAENIADHCHDILEKAAILHNRGFEYIRQDLVKEGKKSFEQAFEILENIKRHDAAYCINNIAVCKMFKGNYDEAIDDLRKALLYQKSYYLELTANTMLMQCYRLTKNADYENIKKKLIEVIREEKYEDPAIIRKICMNLAICGYADENMIESRKYLQKAWPFIKNTSSEYRAQYLYNKINNNKIKMKDKFIFKQSEYFNNCIFEPWFITLSHD